MSLLRSLGYRRVLVFLYKLPQTWLEIPELRAERRTFSGIREQIPQKRAALQSFAFNRELTPPESLWRRRFERKMSHARPSQFSSCDVERPVHRRAVRFERPRAAPKSAKRDYFKELNVRPFINAAGTFTTLTASLMRPEVIEAMNYASATFVPLNDLQEAAGKRVAELIGCEAAMITSGAAAALTVGTAACVAGKNPDWIKRIPDLAGTGMKSEVIVQKSHRYGYDHAVRNCGVKMVEVETSDELERAVNEKTAMMLFFNDADPRGKIKSEEFVALGKKHNIPTFNDAAADVPRPRTCRSTRRWASTW